MSFASELGVYFGRVRDSPSRLGRVRVVVGL